jgi:hypothetical protein
MSDIVLQYVDKSVLGPRGIAISDGKKYVVYRDDTATYRKLQKIVQESPFKMPIFFHGVEHDYKKLVKILTHGTADKPWKAGREGIWTGFFSHSMPDLERGRRSPDNAWWSMTTPVQFCCPSCEAPFPTFGRYSEGYYHCDGCGHRDFDVSSVGV